jgi:hypothetical protein
MTKTTTAAAPATTDMVGNILDAFDAASELDRVNGRDWYGDARKLAETLDPSDPVRGAAVIAVLSPMLSWPMNVRGATDIYAGRPFRGLKGNGLKAERIRDGEAPATVVSGQKVTSFWLNICDPGNPDAVTVDRHAIDIAFGRVTDDATRNAVLRRKGEYARVRDAYIAAAAIIAQRTGEAWHGSQVQAVTWVYWRRERALANHG